MNSTLSRLASGGAASWATRAAWLLFAVLTGLLALYWAKFAYNAYLAATFPAQLEYSEGIIWQQARLIPGPRMYGDLQTYPFLVFHYPPFYHLIVHGLAVLGVPWLMAGRLVSIVSTVALAALIAAFTNESLANTDTARRNRLAAALTAGLLLVTLGPIQFWGDTMRMDMLAVMLEILGMYLGLCSIRRPELIYPSAAVFVLAVYTKQTVILGAAATFAAFLIHTPARALRAAAFAVLLGGIIFAVLTLATGGGFPRHIFFYNVSPFSWRAVAEKIAETRIIPGYPVYLAIVLGAAAVLGFRLWTRPLRHVPPAQIMIFVYFILATANLLSLGKAGGWTNYLIPWMCSWAMLIGLAIAEIGEAAQRRGQPLIVLGLVAALLAQALVAPKFGDAKMVDARFRREYAQLVDLVARAKKPVLSDDMVVLMLAGKEVPWEPAVITVLSERGVFDEGKAIRMIEAHDFSYVVREKFNFRGERGTPAVDAAIAKAYPAERTLARLRVLSPGGPDR